MDWLHQHWKQILDTHASTQVDQKAITLDHDLGGLQGARLSWIYPPHLAFMVKLPWLSLPVSGGFDTRAEQLAEAGHPDGSTITIDLDYSVDYMDATMINQTYDTNLSKDRPELDIVVGKIMAAGRPTQESAQTILAVVTLKCTSSSAVVSLAQLLNHMRQAAKRKSALDFGQPLLGVLVLGDTARRYQINPGQHAARSGLFEVYDVDRGCLVDPKDPVIPECGLESDGRELNEWFDKQAKHFRNM